MLRSSLEKVPQQQQRYDYLVNTTKASGSQYNDPFAAERQTGSPITKVSKLDCMNL